MFTFDERDEGYLVHDEEGRAVASVQTADVAEDGTPAPRPRDGWEIHFTGTKFTPASLAAFADELDALPAD